MRKYDRNAIFNIAVKCVLFVIFGLGCFLLLQLLKINVILSVAIAVIIGLSVIVMFSFLLRFTKFYYWYYSLVSAFLFKEKTGAVYCPCCGKHFEGFKDERFYADTARFNPDMFRKSRQDVICDFCRSAPRHRIIAKWAEENVDLLKSSKILYFAPELSMMLWFKRHGIRVTTADLYDRKADLKLDMTKLDLADKSQDVIFCNHVLEHVSDYSAAMSELHRVLKEGGRLIISFPIDPSTSDVRELVNSTTEERIRLCGQHDHLRVFGTESGKLLERFGFGISTIDISKMPDDILPIAGPADYDSNTIFCCIRK